jgi:aspartate-semialdehyde dehydrogenase
MKKLRIAIVGASGVVGRELITILEDSRLKIASLELFGSEKSAGEEIDFLEDSLKVTELTHEEQIQADIVFFAAASAVSLRFAEKLAGRGVICIDKSSAFRMMRDVPLVASGVNDDAIGDVSEGKIIASPNCVAVPLVQVLMPIQKLWGLKQVVVSTYQAVSGAGKEGTDELETQVRDLFNMREVKSPVFKKRIAFNVLPWIPASSKANQNGHSEEEEKLIEETKKILGVPNLAMDATCVRVPVFNGHSMSAFIETEKPVDLEQAKLSIAKVHGVVVKDDPSVSVYPNPLEASGKDFTMVGRMRANTSVKNGISLWISSDNLRTGAALNAVRIAETINTLVK